MKALRAICRLLTLLLILSTSVHAGDIETPKGPPPTPVTLAEVEPIQEPDITTELESIADLSYEFLQTVLSLF